MSDIIPPPPQSEPSNEEPNNGKPRNNGEPTNNVKPNGNPKNNGKLNNEEPKNNGKLNNEDLNNQTPNNDERRNPPMARFEIDEDQPDRSHLIPWAVLRTVVILFGQLVGYGVLMLPRALAGMGYAGIPVMIVLAVAAAVNRHKICECWSITELNIPIMRNFRDNQYTVIAFNAFGNNASVFVLSLVNISTFSTIIIHLIMVSQIFRESLYLLAPNMTECTWYCVTVLIVLPFTCVNMGKSIIFLMAVSFMCALLSFILYFSQIVSVSYIPFEIINGHTVYEYNEFLVSMGIMFLVFGNIWIFPTIQTQNAVLDRKIFNTTSHCAAVVIMTLYFVFGISGYIVYWQRAGENFALSIILTPITVVAHVFMITHLLSSSIVTLYPAFQQFAEIFRIRGPTQRKIVRPLLMILVLLVGAFIPQFYTFAALIGGTTVCFLTFILPPVLHLKVMTQEFPTRNNVYYKIVTCASFCPFVIGVVGVILVTYSTIIRFIYGYNNTCYFW